MYKRILKAIGAFFVVLITNAEQPSLGNIEVADATGNKTYYEGFSGFKDLELANCTITLLNNVSDANLILNKGENADTNVVLDLNGFTFSREANSSNPAISLIQGASLTIRDSSDAKTGKILADTNAIWINNGDLVIESGIIESTSADKAAIEANAAEVSIFGGKIISLSSAILVGENFIESRGTSSVHFYGGEIKATVNGIKNGKYAQAATSVIVTGGIIDSTQDSISFTTGAVQVSGGTFSTDVSNYCADGFKCRKNADGTYTVDSLSVAKIGTTQYETLAEALNAAQTGDTVTLLRDISVTGKLTLSKSITIDGNDHSIIADETAIWYTVSGKLNIKSYKTHLIGINASDIAFKNIVLDCNDNAAGINIYCAQDVCFENVSITNATKGMAALTVNGSTLTVSGEFKAIGNSVAVDVSNGSGVTSDLGITFAENTKVDLADKTFKFASVASIDVAGAVTESGDAYFVAMDNAYCYSVGQMNTRTTGYSNGLKLLADVTLNKDLTVRGTLDLNGKTLTLAEGKVIKTSGNLTLAGGTFGGVIQIVNVSHTVTAPEGLNVTTSVIDHKVVYADGIYTVVEIEYVAEIGDTQYETLAEALNAAQTGDTIKLIWTDGDAPIAMNGSLFGKTVTITGFAAVDWSKGFLFVGRGGEGNGTIVFDNAILKSASDSASYGIHVSGREKDTSNKYDGTVIICDSTIELDYLINKGSMTMTNSTLTVKNGFAVGGRPAGETENGVDATATFDLTNGSKLIIGNPNGMGLGWEAIGLLTIDETSTLESSMDFLVTSKGILKSKGNIFATIVAKENSVIEISGGIYTQDVNKWCIEGYAALPNLNNQFVVGVKPTATVNNLGPMTIPANDYYIYNGKLTTATEPMPLNFVMQFVANQNAEDMLTSPFADWYADFVITFEGIEGDSFDAKGCYLAGYYGSTDTWDGLWVKIPVDGILTQIDEGVRYPVMLGVGMAQTYDYICSGVQAFSCAMYIPDNILKANPNLKVKLELNIVDSANGDDAAKQALEKGENIFKASETEYSVEDFEPDVELPEVQVIDIKESLKDSDPDLTFALNFSIKDADKLTEDYLERLFAKYGSYYTDYVLTISGLTDADGSVTFNANGTGDGYLAGQYDAFGENWLSVPFENVTIQNGQNLYIMEYAAKLMNKQGLRFTLQEVAEIVQNFDCGVYFTPEFLAANPDLKVVLELKVFTEDANGNKIEDITVAQNEFTKKDFGVAAVTANGAQTRYFSTLESAIAAADGKTVVMLDDVALDNTVVVTDATVTLDLNGKTIAMAVDTDLAANHEMILNSGDLTIIDSSAGGGKLSYIYTGKNLGTSYAVNTITTLPGSVLTVKSGTIENLTYDSATIAYAIDGRTNGNAGDVTINIEGGTITSKRQSIRVFANSTTNIGSLNISGGEITGRVIVQNANASANKAALNITGGIFNKNDYKTDVLSVGGSNSASIDINASITGGIFNGEISDTNVKGFISGGIFNTKPNADYCAQGYTPVKVEGGYSVGVLPNAEVASLGAITIGQDDYKADSYFSYDIINGGKLQESTVPYDLSIAMDFKAKDTVEQAQANKFGNYTTDFFITISGLAETNFVGDGCYLAGYYPSFKAWVKIPLDGFVIENGKTYPVITSAGFDFKYVDICDIVGEFICGIYLTPEVLDANPDIEVELSLGLAENMDAALNTDFITIDSYIYTADDFEVDVELPEVQVIDIKESLKDSDPDLTFALNFSIKDADKLTEDYLERLFAKYGSYYTDYVLTISGLTDADGSVTFNANGTGDGYLAGQYDAFGENWLSVPFENVTIQNGQSLYIMEYAAKLMNKQGLRFTLQEVAEIVQNFDCGVYFTPEFLAANPDLKVVLELKVFTEDANGNKIEDITVAQNEFSKKDFGVAAVTANGSQTRYFSTLESAIAAADGKTVVMLDDVALDNTVVVADATVTLDLNGKTIAMTQNDTIGDGVFHVIKGGELTINDSSEQNTGVINGVGNNDYNIAIWADGGKVIINGGNFTNIGAGDDDHYDLIYVKNGGSIEINGGTFNSHTPAWTLNSHDSLKGTITVSGGTFVGFDPRNNAAESNGTTFMAENKFTMQEGNKYIVVEPTDYILNNVVSDRVTISEIDSVLAGAVNVTRNGDRIIAAATYTFNVTSVDRINPENSTYILSGGTLRPGRKVKAKYIDLATGIESYEKPNSKTVTFRLVIE